MGRAKSAAPARASAEAKRREQRKGVILRALRSGATRSAAAEAAGIHRDTFYAWLHDDVTFSEQVQEVEATVEVDANVNVRTAWRGGQVTERRTITKKNGETITTEKFSQGQWQAAAWWLERRRKDDYRRPPTELTGKDGGPIESRDISGLADHEQDALFAAIEAELASRGSAEPAADRDAADVAGEAS